MSEALRKVLTALGGGRGPQTGFRAYLFTAVRSVALTEVLRPNHLTDDGGLPDPALPVPDDDAESHVAMQALASLPERWRHVLWATRVEELAMADAAQLLGMRPNSVAALAMRARAALRIAYVREHLPRPDDRSCRRALDLLARRSVIRIGRNQDVMLRNHLDVCAACAGAGELIEARIGPWVRSADRAATTDTVRHLTHSPEGHWRADEDAS